VQLRPRGDREGCGVSGVRERGGCGGGSMKPHPTPHRIRKTIKWGGAAVTVLLVVVWIGSGWWEWFVPFPGGGNFGMISGGFEYDAWPQGRTGITVHRCADGRFHLWWWPPRWHGSSGDLAVWVAGWIPVIPVLACTICAWCFDAQVRRRARGGLNLCPKCNYDRAGIAADAVCPECGGAQSP
jgi:hypothetical protein